MNDSHFILAFAESGAFLISALLYVVFFIAPLCAVATISYKLLSLPLRRRERARMVLDLIETALGQGQPLEQTLIAASASRDNTLGVRFHLFAAYLETGLRFNNALQKVPGLVPRQIVAMLKAGERIGDLSKVLPACRRLLNDGVSQTRGALNYLLILAFIVTPFTITVPTMLNTIVLPKFKDVFNGMAPGHPLPAFTRFVFDYNGNLRLIQNLVLLVIWLILIAYIGGPRVTHWINRILPGVADRIFFALPWRRKRLQRDFSTVLSILLDSGVSESEALTLAADATANSVIRRRAEKVRELLSTGVPLPQAFGAMDDSGEWQWRIRNTFERGRNFVCSLNGWHEALDAKAFQLEQTAAQLTTTGVVLFNAVIVGCIVTAMFLALIDLISEAALW